MSWRRVLGGVSWVLASTAAHAETARPLDTTGDPAPQGRWRVGLREVEYGLSESLAVGTAPAPWLLPLVFPDASSVNAYAKAPLLGVSAWSAMGRAGLLVAQVPNNELSGNDIASGRTRLLVAPFSVEGSVATGPVLSAWELEYFHIALSSSGELEGATVRGEALSSNLQLGSLLQYRLARAAALTLRGRALISQSGVLVRGQATLDEGVSAQVTAAVRETSSRPAWQAIPGVLLAYGALNVRFGLGYGNWFVPYVGLVTAEQFVVPDGDLFVVF